MLRRKGETDKLLCRDSVHWEVQSGTQREGVQVVSGLVPCSYVLFQLIVAVGRNELRRESERATSFSIRRLSSERELESK